MSAEGASAEKRKAAVTLALAADGDFQTLKRRERDLRRELAERQADIERTQARIRLTLAMLPVAEAVDWFSDAGTRGERTVAAGPLASASEADASVAAGPAGPGTVTGGRG